MQYMDPGDSDIEGTRAFPALGTPTADGDSTLPAGGTPDTGLGSATAGGASMPAPQRPAPQRPAPVVCVSRAPGR